MLAERHKQVIILNPIALRQFFAQRKLRFFGRWRFYVTPTIGNPMHVGIDTNPRLAVAECYDEIGGLSPHAFELQQLVDIVRHFSFVVAQQGCADRTNNFRFSAVKADGIDRRFDSLGGKLDHRFG